MLGNLLQEEEEEEDEDEESMRYRLPFNYGFTHIRTFHIRMYVQVYFLRPTFLAEDFKDYNYLLSLLCWSAVCLSIVVVPKMSH